jgi:hypothetical protein
MMLVLVLLLLPDVEETFVGVLVEERVEIEDIIGDNFATSSGGDFECDDV